jgi:hypothetical protein
MVPLLDRVGVSRTPPHAEAGNSGSRGGAIASERQSTHPAPLGLTKCCGPRDIQLPGTTIWIGVPPYWGQAENRGPAGPPVGS